MSISIDNNNNYLEIYQELLGINSMPEFLVKYLDSPSLLRLKKIGYFCGMDYASKNIYDFKSYISRYDHSLNVSLIAHKLTHNKELTLAGLFHDIGTPCFSHVIDYMNKDYESQESTEKYTEQIIKNDSYLLDCFRKDNIDVEDIINFKKYTIVDNQRPKLCADRLDGVILPGLFWTKTLNISDVSTILSNLDIYTNSCDEEEIGFKTQTIAQQVVNISDDIDRICHSDEDNFMMELLSLITRKEIDNGYISYEDLYLYDEEKLFKVFKNTADLETNALISIFENIEKADIKKIDMPKTKKRELKPLVNGKRYNY